MSDETPIKVLVGVFPIGLDATIPHELLQRASDEIDRERTRRAEITAAEVRAAIERAAARKPSFLARVLAAIFFGKRRQ